jgi:ankyrin repeat protein
MAGGCAHRLFGLARAGDAVLLDDVDAGAPVDLMDAVGNTLLMLAAYHRHTKLFASLGARGADVAAANDRSDPVGGRGVHAELPPWCRC